MPKEPITLLAKRDFGQKINATFEFVGQNFKPLVKVLLYIAGPPALLAGVASGIYQSGLIKNTMIEITRSPLDFSTYFSLEYLVTILLSVITALLATSATSSFIISYEKEGTSNAITPSRVWQDISTNLSSISIASILATLLTIVGFILFILPSIYVAISISLFVLIIIREKLEPLNSLRRSYNLIEGKWWSTFGLLMIMSTIAGIISMVFQIPNIILTTLGMLSLNSGTETNKAFFIIGGMISLLGTVLVQSLVSIALAFQYYNLIERKEGVGIRSAIDSIGSSSSTDTDREIRF